MVFTLAAMSSAVSRLSSFIRVAVPWAEALPFYLLRCLSRNKLSPAHLQHILSIGMILPLFFQINSTDPTVVALSLNCRASVLQTCAQLLDFKIISSFLKEMARSGTSFFCDQYMKDTCQDQCKQNGEEKVVVSVGPCCALHCVAPAASWHVAALPRTAVAKLPANDSAWENIQRAIAK